MEDSNKKYQLKNIGETHLTSEGYELSIIDGGSKIHYCTIKIHDWITEAVYSHVKKGVVKYPYHKSVYGVGCLGEGHYETRNGRKKSEIYRVWTSFMQRCYDSNFHLTSPTYKDVVVCAEWHNFQVFAEWFHTESNYKKDWALDKDLLSTETKVYSPNTCIFMPPELNAFMTNVQSTNTSGYLGVTKRWGKWIATINIDKKSVHLGIFETPEEAELSYKEARSSQAVKWKAKMKDVLPSNVINQIK